MPYAMCNAVPVGHLVVLFAEMFHARVHPNNQEFIPSMPISGLSLSEGWCCRTVTLAPFSFF